MSAPINISQDIEPVISSLEALASAAPGERAQLTARWREYLREARAGLRRQADLFEGLYRDAVRNPASQSIQSLAAEALEERQEAASHIGPFIDIILRYLSDYSHDPELSSILSGALEIARGTLENFDVLRDRLFALAAERVASNDILRARPVEGEIDHAALSREFMERFPNIRAALAK